MLPLTEHSLDHGHSGALLSFMRIWICMSSQPETRSEAPAQLINKMTGFILKQGGVSVSSGDTLPGRHAASQYHSSWDDLKDE